MSRSDFNRNVVIITGASSGIGRALAYQLADEGAYLSLAARDSERLSQVAGECQIRGGKALAIQTDVSEQSQCNRLIQKTVEEYGRIDTLINNAGQTMWARFDELGTLEPLEIIMQVNYFGSVYCTFAALAYLKQSRGRIVAVSSLTGKTGVPTRSGYAASKHAMVGFFDSLRIELAAENITITIVYPDFVATETHRRAFGPDGKPLGVSPVQDSEVMSADECARIIIRAAGSRKRESVLGFRGKFGQYLRVFAPRITDRIAERAISRGR